MSNLNEKIYDYLVEQNKELTIGEINSSESFKSISRREIAQTLQNMEKQHDVFRNLKNGKAYYHVDGKSAVIQNQVRESIDDLQKKLNGYNNIKNTDAEDSYIEESFYEKIEAQNIKITFNEKKEIACDKYTMKIPDGFSIIKEDGRDFVAFLSKKGADDSEYNLGGSYIQILPSISSPMDVETEIHTLELYSALNEYTYWSSTRRLMNAMFSESEFYPIVVDTTAGGMIHTKMEDVHHYYVLFYVRDEYKQIHFQVEDVLGEETEIRNLVIQMANGFLLNRPLEKFKKLNSEYFLRNKLNDSLAEEWGDLLNQKHSEAMGYLRVMALTVEGSRRDAEEAEGVFSNLKERRRLQCHLQKTTEMINYTFEELYEFISKTKEQNLDNPAYCMVLESVKEIVTDDYKISIEINPGDIILDIPRMTTVIQEFLGRADIISAIEKYKRKLADIEKERKRREEEEKKKKAETLYNKVDSYCEQQKIRVIELDRVWKKLLDDYQTEISCKTIMSEYELMQEIRGLIDKRNMYGHKFDTLISNIDEYGKRLIDEGADYRTVQCISELLDYVQRESNCMDLDINISGTYNDNLGNMEFSLSYNSKSVVSWWKNKYKQMPGYAKELKKKTIEDRIKRYKKDLNSRIERRKNFDKTSADILSYIEELEKQLSLKEKEYDNDVQVINDKTKAALAKQEEIVNSKREEKIDIEKKMETLMESISKLSFFKISLKKQLSTELESLRESIPVLKEKIRNLEDEYVVIKNNEAKEIKQLTEAIDSIKQRIDKNKEKLLLNAQEKETNEAQILVDQECITKEQADLENFDELYEQEYEQKIRRREKALEGPNRSLLESLIEALSEFDRPITITEFMKESIHEVATLSNQRLHALFKTLEEGEIVRKTVEKKKAYFQLIEDL